jgi:hypothetical protein
MSGFMMRTSANVRLRPKADIKPAWCNTALSERCCRGFLPEKPVGGKADLDWTCGHAC